MSPCGARDTYRGETNGDYDIARTQQPVTNGVGVLCLVPKLRCKELTCLMPLLPRVVVSDAIVVVHCCHCCCCCCHFRLLMI